MKIKIPIYFVIDCNVKSKDVDNVRQSVQAFVDSLCLEPQWIEDAYLSCFMCCEKEIKITPINSPVDFSLPEIISNNSADGTLEIAIELLCSYIDTVNQHNIELDKSPSGAIIVIITKSDMNSQLYKKTLTILGKYAKTPSWRLNTNYHLKVLMDKLYIHCVEGDYWELSDFVKNGSKDVSFLHWVTASDSAGLIQKESKDLLSESPNKIVIKPVTDVPQDSTFQLPNELDISQ